MMQPRWLVVFTCLVLAFPLATHAASTPSASRPDGTLTVAVATFGNERWLPHLYVGAEDIVLKPLLENLLNRDLKTGELTPMLAERWEVLDGGRTWRFFLRKGVAFHNGQGEVTAEDVKYTFATLAKEGSANTMSGEFRLIKSMEVEEVFFVRVESGKFVDFWGLEDSLGRMRQLGLIPSPEQGRGRGPRG